MKNSKALKEAILLGLKWIRRIAFHNLGLKVLSIVCALFLWSYVVTSSPTITREKSLAGIDVGHSGITDLESRGLAVTTDLDGLSARVQVRAPQPYFSDVSSDNVRLEMDFSDVQSEGIHQVRIRGTSTYGIVSGIVPNMVTIQVENREQRYVPVNVELTGDMEEGFWYGVVSQNPDQISVTGPASLVNRVSEALVSLDVSGRRERNSREARFDLRDDAGQIVSGNFSLSTSSVRVGMEVYPARSVPLTHNIDAILKGELREGYQVDSVTVTPPQITVAAEQNLLDVLTELSVEPVSVEDVSQSFSAVTRVQSLSGIRHMSSDEVTVSVAVSPRKIGRILEKIPVKCINLADGLEPADSLPRVDVEVEGPYARVKALTEQDITAYVDMSGMGEGQYELPVVLSDEAGSDLRLTCTPAAVNVTLVRAEAGPNR